MQTAAGAGRRFRSVLERHPLRRHQAIEGNKALFINDPRPTLGHKMITEMMQQMTGRKHLVRSLVQMDDPDHMRYRRLTQGWFMGSNLRNLQQRIDELAVHYVDRMGEMGGECDFVKDVAIWFPLRVIMSIFGVPEEDEPLMLKLTQELFGSTDPDVARSFDMMDFMDVVLDFEKYFVELTEARRNKPTDDLASLIANSEIDGERLPQHETNGYYMIIATPGMTPPAPQLPEVCWRYLKGRKKWRNCGRMLTVCCQRLSMK